MSDSLVQTVVGGRGCLRGCGYYTLKEPPDDDPSSFIPHRIKIRHLLAEHFMQACGCGCKVRKLRRVLCVRGLTSSVGDDKHSLWPFTDDCVQRIEKAQEVPLAAVRELGHVDDEFVKKNQYRPLGKSSFNLRITWRGLRIVRLAQTLDRLFSPQPEEDFSPQAMYL